MVLSEPKRLEGSQQCWPVGPGKRVEFFCRHWEVPWVVDMAGHRCEDSPLGLHGQQHSVCCTPDSRP